jgi:hypothetical protein
MQEAKPFLTVQELIDHVDTVLLSYQSVLQHARAGTIDTLYHSTIKCVVDEMMMMPSRRVDLKMEVVEEQQKVTEGMATITNILAAMCDRTLTEVTEDVAKVIGEFPQQDVITATQLRRTNMLN